MPPPASDANAVKLVSELKPVTLSHDASAKELRIWCRKYEAYYHASNMQLASNQVQQAYLLNCLDSELYLRLTSAIAATTPVLGAGASCLTMLANIFHQKYPLLRKTFFSMEQQSGQDKQAFLESIKAAAGEADIQGIYWGLYPDIISRPYSISLFNRLPRRVHIFPSSYVTTNKQGYKQTRER